MVVSMLNYYNLIRPLLYCFPPETAHNLALSALARGMLPTSMRREYPELQMQRLGLVFPSVVGLAAGFDKNAIAIRPLLAQGFGFVEVGTVTPLPQAGNPKPRLFRLTEDEAVINRMGFNNAGCVPFLAKLEKWGQETKGYEGVVGANIGKNKETADPIGDYLELFRKVYGLSDYITINISSPNTPGLRGLQQKGELGILLSEIMKIRNTQAETYGKVPVLVKIAPDTSYQERRDIAEVAIDHKVDGLIISNTTVGEREGLHSPYRNEVGGLSGRPLFRLATECLRDMYLITEGKMLLIGVGGVSSGEDAYKKIRAGASLVQLYSALVFKGFGLVEEIKARLVELLKADGFGHVSEAIGADCK